MHGTGLALLSFLVLLTLGVGFAVAQGDEQDAGDVSFAVPENLSNAPLLAPPPDTNSNAAGELPHDDLDRGEAALLLQAVFEESLDAPAGVFDDLEVEHFVSDHVAVVDAGSASQKGLLQSLLPLRAETENGIDNVVDLDLVPAGNGALEPSNPLVESTIPAELGEGIDLSEASIGVQLAGAPADRAPSIIDGGAAFYPNVATDSDFTVVPTPTGIETFSHLRTPDAPLSQTYELSLPSGAALSLREDGGAVITQGEETLAIVQPPTAIDADGNAVPVSLAVDGSSLTVTSDPSPQTAYPILVDPIFDTYYWSQNNDQYGLGTDWVATSNSSKFEARSYGYGGAEKGLNIYSYAGTASAGAQANWNYHVPRYYTDFTTYGVRPTSFINKMTLTNMNWWIEGESSPYKANPFVMSGLWDVANNKHVSLAVRTGAEGQFFNASTTLSNPNENVGVKEGGVALLADNDTTSRPRHLWVGQATVEISDKDYPSFASAQGPSKWQNGNNSTPAEAIQFEASDAGLGVFALLAKTPKLGGGINQWEQTPGCPGNATVPCPRVWKGGYWNYDPTQMPQGENTVEMIGKDPVWHFSDQASPSLAAKVKVKVDRTQPSLALSGTLTEQGSVGEWLPAYSLKINATDGTEVSPQAGVAKTIVKVDGVVKDEYNPGCATKNCAINREWTLDADDYSAGVIHKLEVTATDGAGLSKSTSFYFGTHGDRTDPAIALSGSMTEQAGLGTTRPSYKLKVAATDPGPSSERKSGVAATTVKVDGAVVDSTSPGCGAGGCSITREWTLNSNSYSVGPHFVEVKATDDAGRTTTKNLTINIARDNTPPNLIATSPFYTAPEGWLEHKSYSYTAIATDANGYGVTSMQLKVDGSVVKSESGTCPAGGCASWLGAGGTIDMTGFDGGAHPAELIATDGAGNSAKRTWTINVDPAGNISVSEATDTLEAVEETAPEATELSPVDALVTTTVGDEGLNPQLTLEGDELASEGTPTPSTVDIDPEDGFSIETTNVNDQDQVQQENIEIVPVHVGSSASAAEITDGSAAVISNSATNVDTIIRPAYDGIMAFQAIRDTTAPESYSWEVKLAEGESLELIDDHHAAINWEDGTQAMLIVAQSAHGADGNEVATSLTVTEGDVITLTVDHQVAGVVYPVVSGVGWEGGFQMSSATIEEPAEEPEQLEGSGGVLGPPKLLPYNNKDDEGASASAYLPHYGHFVWYDQCMYDGPGGCKGYKLTSKTWIEYNRRFVWWKESGIHPSCFKETFGWTADLTFCNWVGKNHQPNYGGYHITSRAVWDLAPGGGPVEKEEPISVYAYPSGYANGHNTFCVCNPSVP